METEHAHETRHCDIGGFPLLTAGRSLCPSSPPELHARQVAEWANPAAEAAMGAVKDTIHAARSLRSQYDLKPQARPSFVIRVASEELRQAIGPQQDDFVTLVKVRLSLSQAHPCCPLLSSSRACAPALDPVPIHTRTLSLPLHMHRPRRRRWWWAGRRRRPRP